MPSWPEKSTQRKVIYFWSGFVFASVLVGISVFPGLSPWPWVDVVLVSTAGIAFGYASARWGDGAWLWLSDRVWWKWLS
jgi:uncharacterized membrane protein